jgi:hypothetical protein
MGTPSRELDSRAVARRVAAVHRFNDSRGLTPTAEGLAAMRARLEEFEATRRAGQADAT